MSRPTTRAPLRLIVVVLVLAAASATSAQTDVPVDAFTDRLAASSAQLDQTPPGSRNAQTLHAIVSSLGLPATVSFPDGERRTVTESSLLSGIDLEAEPLPWEAVTARLQATRDASEAAAAVSPRDRAAVDAALAAAYGGTDTEPGLIERVLGRVRDAIGWLLEHTLGPVLRSGPLGALLAVVLLVGIGLFVASRIGRRVVPDERVSTAGPGTDAAIDWAREAQRAIDAGDAEAAVRALYHLMLETLDRRGIVEEAPSLTAGECRAAVHRRRPALDPVVRGATETFERVTYGNVAADADDVDRLVGAERAARSA